MTGIDELAVQELMERQKLLSFLIESNRIEGIMDGEEARSLMGVATTFLCKDRLTVSDVTQLAQLIDPAIRLRDKPGLNVRISSGYVPPPGGAEIADNLKLILVMANEAVDPVKVHHEFESLHPFTDGNGRTGRLIWLWQMVNQHDYGMGLGFLHMWYYQSLDRGR